MITSDVYHEKSPLSDKDCFVVFDRRKTTFTFPVHVHPEFELNFVDGAKGAQRIVGDSTEEIGDKDLVLLASPELRHAWFDGGNKFTNIHEITIQFHPLLFDQLFTKKQFQSIKNLFHKASRGLLFGSETIEKVQPLLMNITMENDGFFSVMRLFTILHELSKSTDTRELSSPSGAKLSSRPQTIDQFHHLINDNLKTDLKMEFIAQQLHMSRATLARFVKKSTGVGFSEYIIQRKINLAMKKLRGSTPIPIIADECGFNSLSYFYRVFKKARGVTPADYRKNYNDEHFII